jgi:hypothetical protein
LRKLVLQEGIIRLKVIKDAQSGTNGPTDQGTLAQSFAGGRGNTGSGQGPVGRGFSNGMSLHGATVTNRLRARANASTNQGGFAYRSIHQQTRTGANSSANHAPFDDFSGLIVNPAILARIVIPMISAMIVVTLGFRNGEGRYHTRQ